LKQLDNGQNKKKKLSVNLSHALFYLLSTHYYLEMQALVCLHTVQVRAIQFSTKGNNLVLNSSKYGMCRCCKNFQYCQTVDAYLI